MSSIQKRKRLDEINLARAFAIIAVVIVHSTSSGVTNTPQDSLLFPIYNFLNIAGKLGTPTFIMLSSFVLFYNYYPRKTTVELIKQFYFKRLKFILVPYIVFSSIYFTLKWYLYYDYPSIGAAVTRFLELLAIGKAHPHLYFVFISVQLYILFPFILLLLKKYPFLRKNAIWIGILLQWIWVILNKHYFQITIKGSISLSYFSFYFIGAYLGIYYDVIREKIKNSFYRNKVLIPILMGYGMMVVLYTTHMYLVRINVWSSITPYLPGFLVEYISEFTWATHALFAGLVIFYLAHLAEKSFNPRVKNIFMEIGTTSFGIYLIHPLFLALFRGLYSEGPPLLYHGWQIITFFLISFLSWLIIRITYYSLKNHYWILFGKLGDMGTGPSSQNRTVDHVKREAK